MRKAPSRGSLWAGRAYPCHRGPLTNRERYASAIVTFWEGDLAVLIALCLRMSLSLAGQRGYYFPSLYEAKGHLQLRGKTMKTVAHGGM